MGISFVLTHSVLRHVTVPVLILNASLAFAGRMLIVNDSRVEFGSYGYEYFYIEPNTGALFLRNFIFYWQYRK